MSDFNTGTGTVTVAHELRIISSDKDGLTISTSKGIPMKKSERFLVVAQSDGRVVGRHEAVDDAEDEAKRLAVKNGEEYLVFEVRKRVRPKPVDVESLDA